MMRIILVDDESSVLPELVAILKAIPGHDVRVATSAQKAHEHAATLGGVDLLITDVVMEPTDGFTLRGELHGMYPKMRVIFMSQYDLSDYAENLGGADTLAKPVDADVMRGLVEKAAADLAASAMPPKPVAVPQAQPAASGVRQPTAVPQAQPVASGVRQPTAVPQAQPVASGARQPTAVPQAQPVASGVRQPTAVPQAQPVASGVRQPVQAIPVSGVRVAPVVAIPSPIASGVGGASHAVPSASVAVASGDPLVGKVLGDYRVERVLGSGVWGKVYVATQTSVNRLVGLKVLDAERSHQDDARSQFLADARAKAAVSHPFIVSVFEADDRQGVVFYTHEYLDGMTLADLAKRGQMLDEKRALHAMKVASEGLNYLWSHELAHGVFDATAIRIGNDGIARLANLATAGADPTVSIQNELAVLADTIRQLLPANAMSQGLSMLLNRMQGGANAVTGWTAVVQAVKALEPKVVPVEAAKMKAADAAAMRAVEAARTAQKRAVVINIITLSLLVVLIGWAVWQYVVSNERKLDAQVQIPAGSYLVGEAGESVQLPAFEIDKFEVSIGRYAKFIEWCETSDNEHKYDHPNARREISHVSEDVKKLILNAKVRDGRVFKDKAKGELGAPIDLNSPMIGITWWDAYAFAKWEGKEAEGRKVTGGEERDLPTEEEWEAAARGNKGFKFPWGDSFEPKKTNSGADYLPLQPGTKGGTDGNNYWGPVDQMSSDSSPLKVEGMGGNVAEWIYKKEGSKEIPLLKGGSFATGPTTMFDRVSKIPAEDSWFVYPANMKASREGRGGTGDMFFVGDDVKPGVRALYIGFRTVKRAIK